MLLLQVLTELRRMQTKAPSVRTNAVANIADESFNADAKTQPPLYPVINDKVTFSVQDESVGVDNEGLRLTPPY